MSPAQPCPALRDPVWKIFLIFLKLGCTSFGGPVAHLGFFRQEFVAHRAWLDEQAYGDLVTLSQTLPGPASSQVGIALGLLRGGLPGALAAWLGFTLPAALALTLFGLFLAHGGHTGISWLAGLKVAAVAVVCQALWGMARQLCPDRTRITLAITAASLVLLLPAAGSQLLVIGLGAAFGYYRIRLPGEHPRAPLHVPLSPQTGLAMLLLFAALLAGLPLLAQHGPAGLQMFDAFYRTGALVFGGGHVVLPLLQTEVVQRGWVGSDLFLAGYGAAQALPGPLFSFAAFLGSIADNPAGGWVGAILALVAIFLPGFLLMVGTLALWARWREHPRMRQAMAGINAAVVGLLLAALYALWASAIHQPGDFALVCCAFLLLAFWKWPPWLVVLLCAGISSLSSGIFI